MNVCIVIWGEDEIKCSECLEYIASLHVPGDMTLNVMTVFKPEDLASELNDTIGAVQADVRIYVNENILIIYKDFLNMIQEMNNMKENNIGLLSAVGYSGDGEGSRICFGNGWAERVRGNMLSLSAITQEYESSGKICVEALGDVRYISNAEILDPGLLISFVDIPWKTGTIWEIVAAKIIDIESIGYKTGVLCDKVEYCIYSDYSLMDM